MFVTVTVVWRFIIFTLRHILSGRYSKGELHCRRMVACIGRMKSDPQIWRKGRPLGRRRCRWEDNVKL